MIQLQQSPANRVFHYFQEISNIPHGSGNTKAISDYCAAFAREHQLEYHQDDLNNIIIIREASAGYETHKPYILQGHLDMVCEKIASCTIDFEKDGLDLYVEDGFIKARGTTLGADDGIAVAFGLALLEQDDLKSPRLEVVFTVDEETGMYGAEGIDLSILQGRDWLNLDSEDDSTLLCGCAGGVSTYIEYPLEYRTITGDLYQVKIYDLEGGHSGDKINEGHGNPTLMIGRMLQDLGEQCEFGLVEIIGGKKGNVIPRESEVIFAVDSVDKDQILQILTKWKEIFIAEYSAIDPDIKMEWEVSATDAYKCVTAEIQQQIIRTLVLLPDGVITMSKEFPDHVESSTNAGVCYMKEDVFHINSFIRSNVYSRKRAIAGQVKCLAEALGGTYIEKDDYPSWEFKKDSNLRNNFAAVYEEVFGKAPAMDIIHAGLECGIFQNKLDNLDCVAFGPTIHDIHTPRERMEIASVERVWALLVKLLEHGNPCA